MPTDTPLGAFLKERRARLAPATFGFPTARRRTPGLRREEVAQRAAVSATWYTWLEQGRGGAPSPEALDRIAHALALSAAEREHLFLLAHHRPPEVGAGAAGSATPRLQRVLDALATSPAYVKTSAWDVVAWNDAAAAVLTDYGALAPADRNILRLLFSPARASVPDWERTARRAVATFRFETTRAGASDRAAALVDDLSRASPAFAALWREGDVQTYGEGTKHVHHPVEGSVALEYSTFAVDDQPDLGLVVYTPATPADAERVRALIAARAARESAPRSRVDAVPV